MDKLQAWTKISIIAVLLVIVAGATVRATGSGLGCPDWPRCFGEWIPPTEASQIDKSYLGEGDEINIAKTWTEYGNRMIGVLVGFIMLYTMILAWRKSRANKPVLKAITVASLLIPVQAIQGGMVVRYELDPRLVTVHFLTAVVILGFLVHAYILMRSTSAQAKGFATESVQVGKLRFLSRAALALTTVQILVGAIVRGSIEIVASESEGLARGEWLSEVGLIDWVHRDAALIVGGLVTYLAFQLRKAQCLDSTLGRASSTAFFLVLAQCGAGVVLAYVDLPPLVQVIHITLATWLITALFFQERLLTQEARAAA
ncbi:MAG: cytochrome c oxidase assembly protein subunit 15 [Planctomycetota bacterium]|jgi:cytochrome c oxidase assembly protein subunit 15